MFYMLSCFNLRDGITSAEFKIAVMNFSQHMQSRSLMIHASPLGHRFSETPMDTDTDRDHQYFFTTTFKNREQCDRAYSYIETAEKDALKIHNDVMRKVKDDAVFICWEDI